MAVHDDTRRQESARTKKNRATPPHGCAMKVAGHKTEAVYRRYAIVNSADLAEAARKLQAMAMGTISGTIGRSSEPTDPQKASA
jgi:hypothetical protein